MSVVIPLPVPSSDQTWQFVAAKDLDKFPETNSKRPWRFGDSELGFPSHGAKMLCYASVWGSGVLSIIVLL